MIREYILSTRCEDGYKMEKNEQEGRTRSEGTVNQVLHLLPHGAVVYVWSAVDVDSGELLALEASYGRSSLNALSSLKRALKR